jgi:thiol-disulfide isomerase/thioredoxin
VQESELFDDLDVPARLPNASVADQNGQIAPLWDRFTRPRSAVGFYAAWCGPCQKELPQLARQIGDRADVVIVVSADEDLEHTRRQLANLGLSKLGFVVDVTGQLTRDAHVSALPTTFLVTRQGGVIMRTRGYSMMALMRLVRKAAPDDRRFDPSAEAEP